MGYIERPQATSHFSSPSIGRAPPSPNNHRQQGGRGRRKPLRDPNALPKVEQATDLETPRKAIWKNHRFRALFHAFLILLANIYGARRSPASRYLHHQRIAPLSSIDLRPAHPVASRRSCAILNPNRPARRRSRMILQPARWSVLKNPRRAGT